MITGSILPSKVEGIETGQRVKGDDAGSFHQHFRAKGKKRIPDHGRRISLIEQGNDLGRNILPTLRTQPGKQLTGNGRIGFANGPPVADRGQLFVIPSPGLIGGGVPFGRVLSFVSKEGIGQGSDDGFGMLPSDGL